MIYLVEVQHATDHDLDGKWYEVERHATHKRATHALAFLARPRGYMGRPLRVREVEGTIPAMPKPNRPPRRWILAMARAKKAIRAGG